MNLPSSRYRCSGCGVEVRDADRAPFRCPNARSGDDVDHVLVRELRLADSPFPESPPQDVSPFVRFRRLLHSHHLALAGGLSDGDFVTLVRRLDDAVASVAGEGFRPTRCERADALSQALGFSEAGGVWIQDETGQVGGSHKARHLFGVLLHLEVRRLVGLEAASPRPRLAIASCGNAALAAAIAARAGGYALDVFVPVDADPATLARLRELDARVVSCPRNADRPGDPSVHAFREAVAAGALPFTCQGNENGAAIEGGHTLGWEIAESLRGTSPDRLFVQVGGGALATAVWTGLREAHDRGRLERLPRLHTVQTEGGHPLSRAYDRIRQDVPGDAPSDGDLQIALEYAARHRSEFMAPWATPPTSLAEGILDDETYDWWAVVRALLESSGEPVVAPESDIRRANELASLHTRISVGYTGSAGLAGLLTLQDGHAIGPDERVVVLFTGVRRGRGG